MDANPCSLFLLNELAGKRIVSQLSHGHRRANLTQEALRERWLSVIQVMAASNTYFNVIHMYPNGSLFWTTQVSEPHIVDSGRPPSFSFSYLLYLPCICTHIHIYIYIYIYICMYIIYIYIIYNVCIFDVCIFYVCMCIHRYMYIYIHIHTWTMPHRSLHHSAILLSAFSLFPIHLRWPSTRHSLPSTAPGHWRPMVRPVSSPWHTSLPSAGSAHHPAHHWRPCWHPTWQ